MAKLDPEAKPPAAVPVLSILPCYSLVGVPGQLLPAFPKARGLSILPLPGGGGSWEVSCSAP